MNLPQIALTLVVGVLPVAASASDASHHSAYAGQETRAIKSLSADDIAELRRGGGWGLAKAAELNGLPGPTHLLEMRNEIALDNAQIAAIEEIYERMQAAAIAEGEKLISLEEELERHFRSGTITEEILSASLDAIAVVLKDLRYIHLSAHL